MTDAKVCPVKPTANVMYVADDRALSLVAMKEGLLKGLSIRTLEGLRKINERFRRIRNSGEGTVGHWDHIGLKKTTGNGSLYS